MQEEEGGERWEPISVSFPQARVKKIMKLDKEVANVTSDALLRMTCTAEVFLEYLTEEASRISSQEKRKTITYKDIATTIADDSRMAFLREVCPKPMTLIDALEFQKRKKMETDDVGVVTTDDTTSMVVEESIGATGTILNISTATAASLEHSASDGD